MGLSTLSTRLAPFALCPRFTAPAHEALFEASQGIMRRIDTLAHHALAAAAISRAKLIEPEHVLQAAEELRS